jgi:hypothetical protein
MADQPPDAARLERVTRFALRQFMHAAYAKAMYAAQDLERRYFEAGAAEKFLRDAKDAEAALAAMGEGKT